jgi:hypothetical protein
VPGINLGRKAIDRDSLMDTFDPNVEPEGEWATYIPRWRGAFHVHKTRAAALRSCNPRFALSSILYNKQNGRWVEIERHDMRDPEPTNCELCGKPRKYGAIGSMFNYFDNLQRRWVKKRGRVVDPPRSAWMCYDCLQRNY